MELSTLDYEIRDQIGLLTLNRPERKNALNIAMRNELHQVLTDIRAADEIKALILTGAGGAFCAGGDLKDMSNRQRSLSANRERIRLLHVWFHELVNLELPVIAAVDGPAYGAGFNLSLAADFILCTPRARFCAAFGRIGLVPDLGGMFLLPRIVGLQRAKELTFSARTIEAREAKEMGIVYQIHEPDRLMEAAFALAGRFRTASREAIGMAKGILNQSFNLDQRALAEMEAFAQALALDSDYHHEAVGRFASKQPPTFNWD